MRLHVLYTERPVFSNDKSGFSILVEIGGKHILFDTSFPKEMMKAHEERRLPERIDSLVLSHGHIDHSAGLQVLDLSKIDRVICHPECLMPKFAGGESIGSPLSKKEVAQQTKLILTRKPFWIIPGKALFLGEIPRRFSYNCLYNSDDLLRDDSALILFSRRGLIILVGCAHAGIRNILSYAKKYGAHIHAIIGGLHLVGNIDKTEDAIKFIKKEGVDIVYPLHCLNQYSFRRFAEEGWYRPGKMIILDD